jgi:hypothetical protein
VAQDLFQYDKMVERALRGVVRDALTRVAQEGPRGAHHLYIGFATQMPGVVLPESLRGKYPDEMTIVLQHQFWDLKLDDAGRQFSVGLSFGSIPSTLTVPIAAVTGFADPHVQFGLRFRPPSEEAANDQPEEAPAPEEAAPGEGEAKPQVVSLDAFRKRTPSKDQ